MSKAHCNGLPYKQAQTGRRVVPRHAVALGAYLHEREAALPEPLAGHVFVALDAPGHPLRAWGFSPEDFGTYDLARDLPHLLDGVPGVIHENDGALRRHGVRMAILPLTAECARAAAAYIDERRANPGRFSLRERQCSTFALDVLRAGGVRLPLVSRVLLPRDVYTLLGAGATVHPPR